MKEREDVVAAVLEAAGGELIGRVRLQKAVYLMDRLGLGSGFTFDYHHFGPFSRDLDNAVADAKAFGLVEEVFEQRQSDGATYSIFRLKVQAKPDAFGELGTKRAGEVVRLFAATNVTVLELAATVDWLWRFGKCKDWRSEITKRKGVKVQGGRLDQAVVLLGQLDLTLPAVRAPA
ncbi:MAG: hypothetical protein M0002_07580 [Rhodospirillales bacterium]|nr:hypothetical protein [Rhodospirillales bacterium]